MKKNNRRNFIKTASIIGTGLSTIGAVAFTNNSKFIAGKGCIGIVGMDTSHAPKFVKTINDSNSNFKVTTAYTTVSSDIPDSFERVHKFTKEIESMGVKIVDTLEHLLQKVDYVILTTVDGRKHLEQTKIILKAGKRVFIDKPMAASLPDVLRIFNLSEQYKVPVFTSSSIRFMNKKVQEIGNGTIGKIQGADVFAPIKYHPSHPDLFWYGIHGVELLYTVMQPGCKKVKRFKTEKYDLVTGDWGEGRIGNFRGVHIVWEYGGTVYTKDKTSYLGAYEKNHDLTETILHYFNTGEIPVQPQETIEIFAFMEAAHKSSATGGNWVSIEDIITEAKASIQ